MKLPPVKDIKNADEATQLAIDWQAWQSTVPMSIGELADYHAYFVNVANEFNLTDEFRENGTI